MMWVSLYQGKHIQISLMEDNGVDDDIDFSMISPGNDKSKQLNFSVNELLDNPPTQQSHHQQEVNRSESVAQVAQPEGSFLRDLGKMQKSLSYETNPYDIYEPQQQFCEFTRTVQAKQQQTCTRTLNNLNNLTKICQKSGEEDYKHLILDFTQEKGLTNLKNKQSYEDYFEGEILKTKKIGFNLEKLTHLKTKTSQQNITKEPNTNRNKIITARSQKNHPALRNKSLSTLNSPKAKSKSKPIPTSNIKVSKQSKSRSKSKSNLNSKGKQKTEKKVKKKQTNQALSQYFGFPQELRKETRKKSKSSSKGKKIVFSKKNVKLYT